MMLGHTSELRYLNAYYDKEGSQIVVAYGQKNIGKTHILDEFTSDKSFCYYKARAASEREQLYQWGRELNLSGGEINKYPSYTDILQTLPLSKREKFVLIIDEFHHIVKSSNEFMKELIYFVHHKWEDAQILIVLCSSSIGWIENNMINKIGDAAYELSGLLRVKELPFAALVDYFQGFRIEECIEAYAILGGTPGIWRYFDDRLTIKENICKNILTNNSCLYTEGERIVTDELRETSVYSTLLAAIAEGNHKLTDLYLHTGFSRAKISVYLKNLMDLDSVKKVYSYDTEGKDNAQKGIYRIGNHFVDFYFTYLYPNITSLERMKPDEFYIDYIRPTFKAYVSSYYKEVCTQHLEQMNKRKRLPIIYNKKGEWVGKTGTIDMIAQNEEGITLVGLCNWDKSIMTYEDYQLLLSCTKQAKITPDYIYLYSIDRFDEKLNLEAKMKQNLNLVSVDDF